VKFAPQLCTPCHSGTFTGDADVGSVFREFEPDLLIKRGAITQAQAQQEWFTLNQAINKANKALSGAASQPLAGGPKSAQQVMLDYVKSMYPTNAAPAVPLADDSRVPPSYSTDPPGSAKFVAKQQLWKQVIGHYCVSCHRVNNTDLSNYFSQVDGMSTSNGSRALLERYIEPNGADPLRKQLVQMPQASLQSQLILADTTARRSIDAWIAALNSSANNPMCAVTFTVETDVNLPNFDPTQQALRIIGTTSGLAPNVPDPISNFNSAAPGLNMTPVETFFKHWVGTGLFPQGSTISYQATVGKNEALNFEFSFGQPNRTLAIPKQGTLNVSFRWQSNPGSEVVQ
jgi:hypothetical protein